MVARYHCVIPGIRGSGTFAGYGLSNGEPLYFPSLELEGSSYDPSRFEVSYSSSFFLYVVASCFSFVAVLPIMSIPIRKAASGPSIGA